MLQTFITRPILSSVIAILILLVGILSMLSLPISQYPDVVPPTVTVSAYYPGASAEVVQKTTSVPLEEQINGVDNMIYMQSQCANDGSCLITVYFEVGTDPDMATVNVQNRAQRAFNVLPQEVNQGGVIVMKKNPSILLLYALSSSDTAYDTKFLSNYLNINVVNVIKRIKGVGDVSLFGGDDYSMRIWLNPERMAGLGITAQDVEKAIRDQNLESAPGQIGKNPAEAGQQVSYVVRVRGRFTEEKEFDNIIIKSNPDGSFVKIKDIGRSELGLKTYDAYSRLNGKTAPAIAVYQAPGSNSIAVKKACDDAMNELSKEFPKGITYETALDTTLFVTASIDEVIKTLIEAFILVFIVVFIFLQDWRATLIPAITVPISLVGALAAFSFFHMSLNLLTLFALVVAIGIVVDDAIVVLEAIQEKIDHHHMTALDAAKETMKEITGAIITITLVLCAVFIPTTFLGGTTGVMYRQFAITLIASVLISAILALILSPALCAIILRPTTRKKGIVGKFFDGFNTGFDKTVTGYGKLVNNFLHKPLKPVLFLVVIAVLMVFIMKVLPTGFIPTEDMGYFFINASTPKAASLEQTDKVMKQVEKILADTKGIKYYLIVPGYSILDNSVNTTNAMAFISLVPWDKREHSADEVIASVQARMLKIPGGIAIAFNPPAIPGLGKTGGLEFQLEDKTGSGTAKLAQVTGVFVNEAKNHKEFSSIFTSMRMDVPQFFIDLDNEKAKKMGVAISDIYGALQAMFGSYYVNDFNKFGKSYRVIIQADGKFRANPEDLTKIYVRNDKGGMVPLGTLLSIRPVQGPDIVKRFNLFSSSDMTANISPGFSTGQGIDALKQVAAKTLPYGFGYEYSGMTREELISGGQAPMIFAMCFIFVYLLLCAQYESWLLPLPILLAMPFGIFGAFGFQWIRGLQNNIFAQIGLIMLIGLVAKNAILIVEFARQKFESGMGLFEATVAGAKLRFRPILMTSFAFILGVLPLVIAAGAGANSRHALGTSVFGGMLVATICGVLVVPTLYVLFEKMEQKLFRKKPAETSVLPESK